MESISKKLGFLLEGKPYEEMFEFCDFSLNDQNEATQAKGVQGRAHLNLGFDSSTELLDKVCPGFRELSLLLP